MQSRTKTQSANHSYRVRCNLSVYAETFINLPNVLMESFNWQIGDEIEWRKFGSDDVWEAVNVSACVLDTSRFRRNIQSLNKELNDPRHPLQRVAIKCHRSNQVCLVVVSALIFQTEFFGH